MPEGQETDGLLHGRARLELGRLGERAHRLGAAEAMADDDDFSNIVAPPHLDDAAGERLPTRLKTFDLAVRAFKDVSEAAGEPGKVEPLLNSARDCEAGGERRRRKDRDERQGRPGELGDAPGDDSGKDRGSAAAPR